MRELADIQSLKDAVKNLHDCEATHVETVEVADTFRRQVGIVWDVAIFDPTGHSSAHRAYAWCEPSVSNATGLRFFAMLHAPPVDGPIAAVRASVAAYPR